MVRPAGGQADEHEASESEGPTGREGRADDVAQMRNVVDICMQERTTCSDQAREI
jgi:hypothetical protein